MNKAAAIMVCCLLSWVGPLPLARRAVAERASLIIEVDSGVVLHAKEARLRRFPASLAKLMTLYLLFEAIEERRITLDDKLRVSARAQGQRGSRLGLVRGGTISVEEVILALIVRSANDAAVVAAERLAGSERAFAKMMTDKARALCMSRTIFGNASGLPYPGQVTTAVDMAILARALQQDFPQYYHFFSARSFKYDGKTFQTHNGFVRNYEGALGLKTGYTREAGYNLVASAERGGRRLIGVVLGGRSRTRRDARMAELLDEAFARDNPHERGQTIDSLLESPDGNREVCVSGVGGASGWGLAVGVRKDRREARALAWEAIREHRETLEGGRPLLIPFVRGLLLYRACITGLQKERAIATCQKMREGEKYCIVMSPKITHVRLKEGRIAMERARRLKSRSIPSDGKFNEMREQGEGT